MQNSCSISNCAHAHARSQGRLSNISRLHASSSVDTLSCLQNRGLHLVVYIGSFRPFSSLRWSFCVCAASCSHCTAPVAQHAYVEKETRKSVLKPQSLCPFHRGWQEKKVKVRQSDHVSSFLSCAASLPVLQILWDRLASIIAPGRDQGLNARLYVFITRTIGIAMLCWLDGLLFR